VDVFRAAAVVGNISSDKFIYIIIAIAIALANLDII